MYVCRKIDKNLLRGSLSTKIHQYQYKSNKESHGLEAFDLQELLSSKFYASQFHVNRYHWLKSKIILEEFV